MERNVLLTIAYDGSTFHGWQKQPGERTVQGVLEQTMTRLFDREILLSGTSRTDAGVHAYGQRASFKADLGIPTDKIALVVNNALCAREGSKSGRGGFAKAPIRIVKAEEVPPDFHARFNSKGKKYIYKICAGTDGAQAGGFDKGPADEIQRSLVFERNYVYHLGGRLDADAMNEAARYFEGEHDFKSFEASGGNPRETTVRTMFAAGVTETTGRQVGATGSLQRIEFSIEGDGFLYNMVRIMTGTLVEVGQGKRRPEEIKEIIEAGDRQAAGHTAPPGGLYLAEVYY
ncbi:MAG: tRNA pseudouridine(38-40) synthase TruA [Bacillota bacterium]